MASSPTLRAKRPLISVRAGRNLLLAGALALVAAALSLLAP